MPRPTKLSPQLQERLLKGLSTGASRQDVCAWAGVSLRSFQRWLQLGEDEDADDPYREFWRSVNRTERWVKLRLLGIVQQASATDPHLALKFLERKWPEEFGRRSVRVEGTHEVKASVEAPPKLAQLLADPTCNAFLEKVLGNSSSNGNGHGSGNGGRDPSPLRSGDQG